jgi:hypothetical protein
MVPASCDTPGASNFEATPRGFLGGGDLCVPNMRGFQL